MGEGMGVEGTGCWDGKYWNSIYMFQYLLACPYKKPGWRQAWASVLACYTGHLVSALTGASTARGWEL